MLSLGIGLGLAITPDVPGSAPGAPSLLLEDGSSYLLLEDGSKLLLE